MSDDESEPVAEKIVLAIKETYYVGDLLWAKVGHHPYWPCMVSYDPKDGTYIKTKKVRRKVVKIYHVQYFGKQINHGWTIPGKILPFEGRDLYSRYKLHLYLDAPGKMMKRGVRKEYFIPRRISKIWRYAVEEAELALSFDTVKRYRSFVFKYREKPKVPEVPKDPEVSKKRKEKKNESKIAKKPRTMSTSDGDLCRLCEKGNIDLICTGDCSQAFHRDCLGIFNIPSEFKCFDCVNGLLCCFVCKRKSTSMMKCSKCIYYYHHDCIAGMPCADLANNVCPLHNCLTCQKENPMTISKKGPFMQCIRCPTTFHATDMCLPVGLVKLTPSLIICPDHFLGKNKISPQPVSSLNICVYCQGDGELILCEHCPGAFHAACVEIEEIPAGDYICDCCTNREFFYKGMVVWAKTGKFRFWPAQVIGEEDLPDNVKNKEHFEGEFAVQYFGTDEYYWAHKGRVTKFGDQHKESHYLRYGTSACRKPQYVIGLEEAIEAYDNYKADRQIKNFSKPVYKHIKVNRVVAPLTAPMPNLSSISPCVCDPQNPNPCGPDSNCINRTILTECNPAICPAGEKCENQKFQKRQYPSLKMIKTENCGWGLKTLEFIPKGSFVIEYVGEIITHEEYRKRSVQMQEQNNNNFYFLYLDFRRMIDAGPKGNLSRFINHSCSPNCEMEKWSVNGDTRIGIFALSDIQPEEEITFNYQTDTVNFEQECNCGSDNCQGIIGRKTVNVPKKKK